VIIADCGLVNPDASEAVPKKKKKKKKKKSKDATAAKTPQAFAIEAAQRAMMRRRLTGGTSVGARPPEQVHSIFAVHANRSVIQARVVDVDT